MRIDETPGRLSVEVGSEAETDRLGAAIAGSVGPNVTLGLVGPLGAGKTRLVRGISGGLGVDPRAVSSPTFVLIHEYEGRCPVYHFDAYRLGGPDPFEALGVADYWEAGGVCLVEWADIVAGVMPAGAWWVVIEPTGGDTRRVTITAGEAATARLAEALRRPAVAG